MGGAMPCQRHEDGATVSELGHTHTPLERDFQYRK